MKQVSKNRLLEAREGGQGDLPCYQILKCAVGSTSPIYNCLGKDERATGQLAGLRPAGESVRSYLKTSCKFLPIFLSLLWKSGEELSDNREELNSSIPFPIPSALAEVGYFSPAITVRSLLFPPSPEGRDIIPLTALS